MSLGHPNRQSKYDLEITRMASHPDYTVHGAFSYLLKWFKNNIADNISIVTFSDNRLFSGQIYEKMGFVLDEAFMLNEEASYTSMIFLFGGAGLFASYYVARKSKD